MDDAQRRELTGIVARESAETLVGQARGARVEIMRRLIRPVASTAAGRFTRYDRMLGESGICGGAARIIADATGGIDIEGRERVPTRGPLLVVANHPGVADAVALLSALGRDDAWVVAADFPFLHAMRSAKRRFLFVPAGCAVPAFRRIVARLRDGASVVVFPAGGLEIDPALSHSAALASLASWSRSIALFARMAHGTRVIPTVISGAVSRSAFDHPLARRRQTPHERQRMATLLQLALPTYRGGRVRVAFGQPIDPRERSDVNVAVTEAMRALMVMA
jgi:1-acyl-sn-glycerol-3-phosphate acyltransferase